MKSNYKIGAAVIGSFVLGRAMSSGASRQAALSFTSPRPLRSLGSNEARAANSSGWKVFRLTARSLKRL